MNWKTVDIIDLRKEFVHLATQEGANRRELCRHFGISAKTAYKWLEWFAKEGNAGLQDRSRRPLSSPTRSSPEREQLVIALRQQHPRWGGRKIRQRLEDLGHTDLPSAGTVTHILRRNGLITPSDSAQHTAWIRFEHDTPNVLWQIDFKGNFETLNGNCYPLTMLDDHSRFNLALHACAKPSRQNVEAQLIKTFERYGMPLRINTDNGPPWGSPAKPDQRITKLTMWLMRLGIQIRRSRPAHPQTNGKIERFHRTLKEELLMGRHFTDLRTTQAAFDDWRNIYNTERPHDAINLRTPVTRYQPSPFKYPTTLPPVEYLPGDIQIKVGWGGEVQFEKRRVKVSTALEHHIIAARPVDGTDGLFELFYCRQRLMQIDLRISKNPA